jgi:SAM-dependent methyltransferase
MRRPESIARQSAHPRGWLGRLIGRVMVAETAGANDAALALLALRPGDRVLEVGCGAGRSLALAAARAADGTVVGVDHSDAMLRQARRHCASLIAAGRVTLHAADSGRLPFAGHSFDKALAVHAIYFWKAPLVDLGELRRVLRPGGHLVLGYRPADDPACANFPESVYRFRNPAEIESLLASAGFTALATQRPSAALCLTSAQTPEVSQ